MKRSSLKSSILITLSLILLFAFTAGFRPYENSTDCKLKFSISFPEEHYKDALDGRVLLLISKDIIKTSRFQGVSNR